MDHHPRTADGGLPADPLLNSEVFRGTRWLPVLHF